MAIISPVGRKSPKVRFLVATIYLALIAGSLTMIYPFLLMLSGSTKSAVDSAESVVVPRFLLNETELYRKHIEGLFNESLDFMRYAYDLDVGAYQTLEPPTTPNAALVSAWRDFLSETHPPDHAYGIGYLQAPISRGVVPHNLRRFKGLLLDRYEGDIARLNADLRTEFVNWNAFFVLPRNYLLRRNAPEFDAFALEYRDFKAQQPFEKRYYFSVEGFFKTALLKTQYTRDIGAYNAAHDTQYASWDEVHLDARLPSGPRRTEAERKDWEIFVRSILNLLWIRADTQAVGPYQRFLEAKYRRIEAYNRDYETDFASFGDIPLFTEPPREGIRMSDWDAFLQGWQDPEDGTLHRIPVKMLRVESLDFQFRDYLKKRYGSIAAMNGDLGTEFSDWMAILPPQLDAHFLDFEKKKAWLRWEFARRNYLTVLDYIGLHGRGVLNTVIYCALAILAALIVNPLAAYALSRYRTPSTYKVLLFLMLTMAFPPMVTQIPVFLMLRRFDMLNSFWALVLPGLAHGYSIFLLKGFFDSLPRELYESAAIDGAGEFRIFWQITMSLSKPILAVIALQAFTIAYSNFIMALLICQDEKMWTLMPWLYQLQQRSGTGIIFASLIIAAIPTFVVFAFCQNVIMRGIVVPVEK
ncbi:ABC transporter permease subunit [bacterium]|nr:ABC transporter permease subunit [bacterium]